MPLLPQYKLYPNCKIIKEDQIKLIIDLYHKQIPIPQIAKILNIKSYVHIVNLLEYNNIRKKLDSNEWHSKKAEWTKISLDVYHSLRNTGMYNKQIAKELNVTIHVLKQFIRKNNLFKIDKNLKLLPNSLMEKSEEIIKLFNDDHPIKHIAKMFNCTSSVISLILEKNNVSYRTHNLKKFNNGEIDIIKQLYIEGKNTVELAKLYNCSAPKITRILQNTDLQFRTPKEVRLNNFNNSEYVTKFFSSSGKKKEYILPNNEIITLRGYEPQFLDYIFNNKIFDIDDIDYKPSRIEYFSDKTKHFYYPDFYIKSLNLIVEIKSTWIYNKQGTEKNKMKKYFTELSGKHYYLLLDNDFGAFQDYLNNFNIK